eukprot:scaffold26533_cov129-Isochrysis_galbana.AAC.2
MPQAQESKPVERSQQNNAKQPDILSPRPLRANATGHSTILWQTSIASPFPPSLYGFPRRVTYHLRCTRLWGWLGLVLHIGPGWGYGGGPRRGAGRCGLPFTRGRGGPGWLEPVPYLPPLWSGSQCDPTEIGVWEIGSSLGGAKEPLH